MPKLHGKDINGNWSDISGSIEVEKDPTVPAWAKNPTKPEYTASEVGALPASTKIPAKTSELSNDSGFITKTVSDLVNYYTKSQTYTKEEVNGLISAIPKFSISVVSALPTSEISTTTVYLLTGGAGSDLYTEYIYVNGSWEILGSQRVDLTGYVTDTALANALQDYVSDAEFEALTKTVIRTYILQEGETVDDAPEWADEVIDPFHDPESEPGGDVDLEAVNERLDELSEVIAELDNKFAEFDSALATVIGSGVIV